MSATSRRLQLSRTLFYANFRVNLLLCPSLFSSTSLATLAQWNGQPIRAWRKLPQLIFEVETNPATRWQPLAPSVCFGACQTITSASRRPPLAPRVQRPSRLFPLPDLLQGTAFPRGPLRTCLAASKLATIFVRLSSPILVVQAFSQSVTQSSCSFLSKASPSKWAVPPHATLYTPLFYPFSFSHGLSADLFHAFDHATGDLDVDLPTWLRSDAPLHHPPFSPLAVPFPFIQGPSLGTSLL